MCERPTLTLGLKRQDFLEYYYLKEELVKFCHDNGLPVSGGKQDLTERIAYYLDTGKIKNSSGTASLWGVVRHPDFYYDFTTNEGSDLPYFAPFWKKCRIRA